MSVSVPRSWRLTGRGHNYGQVEWVIEGANGQLDITSTPLTGANGDQLLPLQPSSGGLIPRDYSPYRAFSSTYAGHQVTEDLVSSDGTSYQFTLNLFNAPIHSALGQHILTSWSHPPLLSVTAAVHKLIHMQDAHHESTTAFIISAPTPRDMWLLAAGQPATAQEPFYLFRTTNQGRTWGLERYTQWQCSPITSSACNFIGSAGPAAMRFWNSQSGIIASGSSFADGVGTTVSHDGGRTWTTWGRISLANPPQRIVLLGKGSHLTMKITVLGQGVVVEKTDDGGEHWQQVRIIPVKKTASQSRLAVPEIT
jgi:hypothetical protein